MNLKIHDEYDELCKLLTELKSSGEDVDKSTHLGVIRMKAAVDFIDSMTAILA